MMHWHSYSMYVGIIILLHSKCNEQVSPNIFGFHKPRYSTEIADNDYNVMQGWKATGCFEFC